MMFIVRIASNQCNSSHRIVARNALVWDQLLRSWAILEYTCNLHNLIQNLGGKLAGSGKMSCITSTERVGSAPHDRYSI